jgi:hypothetical protein
MSGETTTTVVEHLGGLGLEAAIERSRIPPARPVCSSLGERLWGRDAECDALDRLLANVRGGQSGVLWVSRDQGDER